VNDFKITNRKTRSKGRKPYESGRGTQKIRVSRRVKGDCRDQFGVIVKCEGNL